MHKKYFFFDIDGTLTNDDTHLIVPSALHALQALKRAGHFVSIATGRAHYKTVSFSDPIGIQDLVCAGGGCLVVDGRVVQNKPLDQKECVCLLEKSDAAGIGWLLMLDDSDKVYFRDYRFLESAGFRQELTTYVHEPELDYHKLDKIYKIYLAYEEKAQKEYPFLDSMGHLRLGQGYCVYQYNAKKQGILDMMAHLHGPLADVVVFGNDVNDLVMFDPRWTSIAMGNGVEALKEKADYVAAANTDDGILKTCLHFGWIPEEEGRGYVA